MLVRLIIKGFLTDIDDFIKGNVGVQAGRIKGAHEDIRADVKSSGAPWSSTMPPSLGRGRVINNNNNMSLAFMVLANLKEFDM